MPRPVPERGRRVGHGAGAFGLRALVACIVLLAPTRVVASALAPGAAVEDAVGPGEVRRFEVEAAAGMALHLRVDHRHLDVAVRVLDPAGAPLATAENLLHRVDPLTLTALVTRGGPHRIEVWLRRPRARGGRFRLALGADDPATDADRLRLEAQRLRAEADQLVAAEEGPRYAEALAGYQHSVALWRAAGDEVERTATLTRAGELLEVMGRLPDARATLEEALKAWRAVGDRDREADCMGVLGLVTTELGQPHEAVALLEQALALRRTLGPLPGSEATILNFLGVALGNLGELSAAVDRYTDALALAREDGDPELVALVLKNRALDLEHLGDTGPALADLREARDQFHLLGNAGSEGTSEYSIGIALARVGRSGEAWRAFERALGLLERAGAVRFVAFTLNHMGLLRLEAGRPDEARARFEEALRTLETIGDRRSALHMRMNLARTRVASGRPAEAIDPLVAIRDELHAIGDRNHEALCLTYLAGAELASGLLLQARRHVLEALELTEELRSSIAGPNARAAYAAVEHERYELLAGVLMALHAREPDRGWDAAALEASETARARALLEVLAAARVDVKRDVSPALRDEERALEERTERTRRSLVEVLGRQHRPDEADAVEKQLEELRADRERLRERMRASSPRYAALVPARARSVAEIRTEVLDEGTALVEYLVGERQSFVWVLSRRGLRSAVLPGRRSIERAVTALHRRWSDPDAVDDGMPAARALSRMVLGPVAAGLGPRRLLVVADGALQQIPFAALPEPGRGRALLERHTVVSSPSASVLAALATRPPPPAAGPELAVLADPVLGPGTRREGRAVAALSPVLLRSMQDVGLRALEPLPGTRAEAEAIAATLPPDRVLRAFGPEASRSTAMGPGVASARIVHFATHALLDVKRPELSGIVLSAPDAGRAGTGFLSLADISSMRLSAELVVLSACQTGLGKEVRGEGLVGLTRGFMDAGVPRVVASLWKVSDTATAALMSSFYEKLLVRHLSPADALREAELALRQERRTSSPHAWAGFVLQGDWHPLSGTVDGVGSSVAPR